MSDPSSSNPSDAQGAHPQGTPSAADGSSPQGPAPGVHVPPSQGPASPQSVSATPVKRTRAKSQADGKLKPQKTQIASAKALVSELHTMTADGQYTVIFGSTALPAEEFSTRLDAAATATAAARNAQAQARTQSALALTLWDTLLRQDEPRFRAAWDLAVANDPTLPNQLPGAAGFLGARSASAARGASTRKQRVTGSATRPRTKG